MDRPLTKKQESAALAVADDRLSDSEIARSFGVTVWTIDKWKQRPDFRARVDEHRRLWREQIRAEGLTNKQNRLDGYNADYQRLSDLITARAADPLMADIPGGTTGLLVAEPVLVKIYEASEDGDELMPTKQTVVLYKYSYDDAVLRRRQELAKSTATELGQWTEKHDIETRRMAEVQVTHEHRVSFDDFARAFLEVAGGGAERLRLAPIDGVGQPLDSTESDRAASSLSDAANS